jgi:hypothetical protein
MGAWWMDTKIPAIAQSVVGEEGDRREGGWVVGGWGGWGWLVGGLAIDWSKDLGAVSWSILKNGPSGFEVCFVFLAQSATA